MNSRQKIIPPSLLLDAYASGIFPMAEAANDEDVHWIDPQKRGILPLERFHLPKRFARYLRHHPFRLSVNTAFERMVRLCAESAPDRPETWINETILRSYCTLHAMGFAHSVECWKDGQLAGGLYGVSLGGAFFGESMVSRAPNASKVALARLVALLRGNGYTLLDTQFLTAHLTQFGAVEIERKDYHRLLANALERTDIVFRDLDH